MSLTNENMVMPVSPMYGNNGGLGGFGGGDGWMWILFLIILLGGWGNGNGFGGGDVQRGFDQSAVMNGITGVQSAVTSGFGDVQTALCGGFAGVNASISNGFAQAEIANNARQIADLQQMFALQSQMANCCCENRAATADLKYTIATEACADRAAASANTQTILDKLCQLELDAKNDKIADLERQLTMANLSASQTAQTASILADNARQTSALEQYLNPAPIPAYVVQNPNCCTQTCGCGM